MDSHTGLRGVAALWIAVYHFFGSTSIPLNPQGWVLLPLFFILSGFSLTAVYGSRPWKAIGRQPPCRQPPPTPPAIVYGGQVADDQCQPFDCYTFFYNRFARIMPLYYLCNAIALPFVAYGHAHFGHPKTSGLIQVIIFTIIPICTLVRQGPLDGPAWFVATLAVLWLFFPWWLTRAQRQKDKQLIRGIVFWYYLHLVLYTADGWVTHLRFVHPILRFPLFALGINAGVLCTRHPPPSASLLPWPSSFLGFFPYYYCSRSAGRTGAPPLIITSDQSQNNEERVRWAKISDRQAINLFFSTLVVIVVASVLDRVQHKSTFAASWFQAMVVFAQLELVVALTRDDNTSLASRALRTPLALWLGKISAALYLIHIPVYEYVAWAVLGHYPTYSVTPQWTVLVYLAVSISVAAILFYGFEEPIRRSLRSKTNRSPPTTTATTSPLEDSSRVILATVPLVATTGTGLDKEEEVAPVSISLEVKAA